MKDIQLIQRETVFKVLAIATVVGYFAMAGGIGLVLTPTPYNVDEWPLINCAISLAMALFAWSTFKLIEPLRYSHNWQIAKLIFVPLGWLLLTVAIDMGLLHVVQVNQDALCFTID
jgi:hypothetical protein